MEEMVSTIKFDKEEFTKMADELMSNKVFNARLMDSLPFPAMLIRRDRRMIAANKAATDLGVEVGTYCWDTFGKRASISEQDKEIFESNGTVPQNGIKCTFCRADEALASKQPINEKIPAGDVTFDTYWVPLTDDVYLHYAIVM